MPAATPSDDAAVRAALSAAQAATYVTAANGDPVKAMQLYGWNARISAVFMLPAHFAEVTTRNAAGEVLTAVYGPDWPWDTSFTGSLPSPSHGYRPREDLVQTLRNRIAHHEPVITRNLLDDLNRMIDLVELRSQPTAVWVRALEDVTHTLAERP